MRFFFLSINAGETLLFRSALNRFFLLLILFSSVSACSVIKEKQGPGPIDMSQQVAELTPEESQELLKEAGNNWLYGQGVGNTILHVGTTVLFPPYGLLLLGNAALELSGYQAVGVSDFLPGQASETWETGYDGVTSVPGRLTSVVAGEEFRTDEMAQARLEKRLTNTVELEYLTLQE